MARTRVLVAGMLIGLLGLAGTTVSAQEPGGVAFEADTRIARAGNSVMLEAAGLTGCEGELVELGFFEGLWGPEFLTFEDRFGRLMHPNFRLEAGGTDPSNTFGPVTPHHEPTPPPNAPGAPDAGTGFRVERGEFGPGLLAGAAVLGLGTLATVLAAVARSRRW